MKIEWTFHNLRHYGNEYLPVEYIVGFGIGHCDNTLSINIHLFIGFISINFGGKNE